MTSLMDIAPLSEEVELTGGRTISVGGVGADGIAYMLTQSPELRQMMAERKLSIDADGIAKLGPQMIAMVIACGSGFPGNREAEQRAAKLGALDQLKLINAIMRCTMPSGIDPFVEEVLALANRIGLGEEAGDAVLGKGPATSSRAASNGAFPKVIRPV